VALQDRRERERADRRRRILEVARELAEADGWDAVTVRRLAERIEYSQPVLYSHFAGRDQIIAAVALDGFAELARACEEAAAGVTSVDDAPAAVATAYVYFAEHHPALYDAMFTRRTSLAFGAQAPAELHAAFASLHTAFAPVATDDDTELFTEVAWSALHGLATLARDGRLRPGLRDRRLALLLDVLTARPPGGSPAQRGTRRAGR
jgi:AcrR family transcriptional regulator